MLETYKEIMRGNYGPFLAVLGLFLSIGAGASVAMVTYITVDTAPAAIQTLKTAPVISQVEKEPEPEVPATAADKLWEDESVFPEAPQVAQAPRLIDALEIEDVVPPEGKLIVADLEGMTMQLYLDGEKTAEYPLMGKGRPGSHWETPSGLYTIHTKERTHLSSIGGVYMPYSMQFFGNYFIHGRTYYPDGTQTSSTYSGGCIRMETVYAEKVYNFADIGTKVFVYDPPESPNKNKLALHNLEAPAVSAAAYLIADLDTGDVYAEKNASTTYPIGSITKLMTAIVANETISYKKRLSINDQEIGATDTTGNYRSFGVESLVYPLLLSSSDGVANALSGYLGNKLFLSWMNNAAEAYSMNSTTFADSAGASPDNLSTADDLYRLAWYITNKKSFALEVLEEDTANISASNGSQYTIANLNTPAYRDPFGGGKAAAVTNQSTDAMLSLLNHPLEDEERRLVLVVLGSTDREADMKKLATWVEEAVLPNQNAAAACVACASPTYRNITRP